MIFSTYAQNDSIENPDEVIDTLQADFKLFSDEEVLDISLRFDITEYRKNRTKNEYIKALLTYHINEKDSINKEIRIKSRGASRSQICGFPPMRLNFKAKDSAKTDAMRIEKLKLVTHCNSGNENNLLKEYLIYKLYNVLTDYSFRVRLLKMNYINTRKKDKPIQYFAFVIEPIEFLAERTNTYPVLSNNLSQANIQSEIMDRMAIFNYMVGNTDWAVPNQHNCKILTQKLEPSRVGIIVPYDFDYSGLVNASYAIPNEALNIKSVQERIFQGICRSEQEYMNALKEFSNKKDDFYKIVNEFKYLDERIKKDMIEYLDQFYSEFNKRNSIVYGLLKNCKEIPVK